ncbi:MULTISPECIES: 50S ribosomal protein L23 [Porphyromonas]|uniref:Large ribosomal subunit protein uL23 n=1 Tax=Porphyromonas canoris TaxID=36875 RepID=A0ABR4XLQ6_9PORP|nr:MULTISPECIES: 50S ribosomal protein L23 [Porphyromonas]MDO4789901.1 50S ribosomal protein L23 [Porphyromonas sp.]KGL53402.1 50S ribosomal protein L23 [Porphyromonas canoris]KGN69567.1 50S ribosomal protein L23 [Porphyromonas sp. COT-108 OH1349]KGN92904.1 50S ribosomal protein L23 [Porphyromonas canoris]KGN96196.1 50S ribosomal protein L23 [Porphyromonas sp. COT-108 OH2963]
MSILIKPIITEKQTEITENMPNRYGFRVSRDANKIEIKNAIKKLYGVDVKSVNTMNYDGKRQVRYTKGGVIRGRKSAFKKAVVTIEEGQTIDFYSNI